MVHQAFRVASVLAKASLRATAIDTWGSQRLLVGTADGSVVSVDVADPGQPGTIDAVVKVLGGKGGGKEVTQIMAIDQVRGVWRVACGVWRRRRL
jgi:hypothetical protein